MSPRVAGWQALRVPLLALAAALLAGAVLVFFTYQALAQEKLRHAGQEGVLREARERMLKSGDEKARILRYRTTFDALLQRGFIGEEQRINWVDALRAVSLNLGMTDVHYQIEAQQPYGAPLAIDAGPYHAHQSLMKISLGLRHEEDLMHFVNALNERQAGAFTLRECSLQHQNAGKAGGVSLQAECSLAWLSISEAKGAP